TTRSPSASTPRCSPTAAAPAISSAALRARSTACAHASSGSRVRPGLTFSNSPPFRCMLAPRSGPGLAKRPGSLLPGTVAPPSAAWPCPVDLRPAGARPACRLVAGAKAQNTGTMGWADGRLRARRATRRLTSAAQSSARVGASASRGAGRVVQRMTGASGAGRTGLSNLIELTAASSVGGGFLAVALAGTLFFNASVSQARSQVAIALLVTMAPFAVLAPLIGPMLDRVQQGRRFILAGTLLARGLLCWGMAGAVFYHDSVTLLPAAFGVLVLQKAY